MSILDRLNRRLVAHLHRGAPNIAVEDDAIRLLAPNGQTQRLPFETLTAATVLHCDVYSADAILLRLKFQSGDQLEIFQDNPVWEAVVSALDHSGRVSVPAASWQMQSMADGCNAPPRELLDS